MRSSQREKIWDLKRYYKFYYAIVMLVNESSHNRNNIFKEIQFL